MLELSPDEWAALPAITMREALADASHDIWSHWMRWMFTVGTFNADGTWTMPAALVERWQRQMETHYDALTEREKDSDREQADKILAILNADQHLPAVSVSSVWEYPITEWLPGVLTATHQPGDDDYRVIWAEVQAEQERQRFARLFDI